MKENVKTSLILVSAQVSKVWLHVGVYNSQNFSDTKAANYHSGMAAFLTNPQVLVFYCQMSRGFTVKHVIASGVEESSNSSEGKDDGTHSNRAAGAGEHPPVSVPGHAALRLSDPEQAASHPG